MTYVVTVTYIDNSIRTWEYDNFKDVLYLIGLINIIGMSEWIVKTVNIRYVF